MGIYANITYNLAYLHWIYKDLILDYTSFA